MEDRIRGCKRHIGQGIGAGHDGTWDHTGDVEEAISAG